MKYHNMLRDIVRLIINHWLRCSFFLHSFIHAFIHTNHECTHLWAKAAPPSSIHLFFIDDRNMMMIFLLPLSTFLHRHRCFVGLFNFYDAFSFSSLLSLSFLLRSYKKRKEKKIRIRGILSIEIKQKKKNEENTSI